VAKAFIKNIRTKDYMKRMVNTLLNLIKDKILNQMQNINYNQMENTSFNLIKNTIINRMVNISPGLMANTSWNLKD
jgi:hypothetical protein